MVVIVAGYAYFVPAYATGQYQGEVQAAAHSLEGSFRDLGKSVELPVIANQEAEEKIKQENTEYILGLIDSTRKQLATLETASRTLNPLPYADFLGQYGHAKALKSQTNSFIQQSEDALDGYQALITYLEAFNKAVGGSMAELNDFNQTSDLNSYSGQAEQVRQIADKIRADASELSRIKYPSGRQAMNEAAVRALNEAASGFDDLANGLAVPADEPIYAAARRIENATVQLEKVRSGTDENSLYRSRAIKNIQDLGDKFELIRGQNY